jgi:Na+/H+ antiporter NhaD/arsenite permease-like protein
MLAMPQSLLPPLFAAAEAATAVVEKPMLPMIVLGVIMTLTYVAIAFDWLHKSLAAMLGAIAAVSAALVLGVFKNEAGHSAYDRAVHDIIGHDVGVIGVIVGTSVLVEVAGRSGLFHFLAVKIVKATQGDAVKLLVAIAGATMLFVTFLSIAPGSMIVASLCLVVTHELRLDPRPYMMAVGLVANSAALMTFSSGICTIMLATAGNLPYSHFFFVSTPMALISAAITVAWLRWWYRGVLVNAASESERMAQVEGFDEWALVKDRRLFYRSAIILGGTILGFASAQRLGIGTDFVAFCGGTAALLFSGIHPDEAIKKVNWSLILFFVGLFVIIGAVQETGLLDWAARQMLAIADSDPITTMLLMAGFVLALSGVLDNIPVAATLIPLVRSLESQGLDPVPLWWTLVIAANLGGNSTPIGSVSSVIALNGLEKERGMKVGWGEFLKVGGGVTVLQSVVVLAYLWMYATFNLFPGSAATTGGAP